MARLLLETDAPDGKFPLGGDDAAARTRQTSILVTNTEVTWKMEAEMSVSPPNSSHRPHRKAVLRFHPGLVAAPIALIAIGAPLAAANASVMQPNTEHVLHYFSKFESQVFLTAAGKPFSPSEKNPPVPGDSIDSTNLDYVGNYVHHAPNWTASDQELCVLNNKMDVACQAQVAIGGSMILAQANLGQVSASTSTSTFEVTGGTGTFQGVTGTIVAVNIDPSSQTSDSDATITLRRP
jgi:hypothetical protein